MRTLESLSVWYILLVIFRQKGNIFSSNRYNKKWTRLQFFSKDLQQYATNN